MITFCGYTYRSSGIVRGKQLSQKIRDSQFLDVDRLGFEIPRNKVNIYVRKLDSHHLDHCKKAGIVCGYDISDNPVTDYTQGRVQVDDFSRYVHPLLDFYIVNNDVVENELSKHTDKPIHIVPHHHCNFDRKRNPIRTPRTIGYIGLPEQSINSEELSAVCLKHNLKFINKNIVDHVGLDDAFSEIDIGLVYFERPESRRGVHERILKYKPGTKLTNFQSYGIPTICLPYVSFKQFGGEKCLFVENLDDVNRSIERLVLDPVYYKKISDEGVEHAETLHIDALARQYEEISLLYS